MDIRPPDELLHELSMELSLLQQADRREALQNYINYLLLNDFNALVYLLYRADVDEKKLKEILAVNKDNDASVIITDLLIKRLEEKAKAREMYKANDDIPEDEKW